MMATFKVFINFDLPNSVFNAMFGWAQAKSLILSPTSLANQILISVQGLQALILQAIRLCTERSYGFSI